MTTDRSSSGGRRRGLGVALFLVVVAACSSAPATTTPSTSLSVTTRPSEDVTTVPAPAPEPGDLLRRAVEALQQGYEFSATLVVDGQTAATTTGRWQRGSSILTVESGAAAVEYLITPEGQWARTTSGEWSQVEEAAPVGDPVAPVADPLSAELVSWDGSTARIAARYPAERLGRTGDPIDVTLTVVDGVLTELSYSFEADGAAVEATTTFTPRPDGPAITSPGSS